MNGRLVFYMGQNDAGREAKRLLEDVGIECDMYEQRFILNPMLRTPVGWSVGLAAIRDFVSTWKGKKQKSLA